MDYWVVVCTIGKETDYKVVIVLVKKPYLYILTNMSLNLNSYCTRTVDCKTPTLSVFTHTHTTIYYIVDISLKKRSLPVLEYVVQFQG